jgi:hypothetical protein
VATSASRAIVVHVPVLRSTKEIGGVAGVDGVDVVDGVVLGERVP